jgi:hypothetical protein
MIVLEKQFVEWQPKTRHETAPMMQEMIDDDCILIDKEHQVIVAAQIRIRPEMDIVCSQISRMLRYDLKWALEGKKPARLSGIRSANRVFGILEPNKLRRRFGCTQASLNREQPELLQLLEQISVSNFELFKEIDLHRANEHQKIVNEAIHPDWLMAGTPFTSGVINYSSALPYHKDSGNVLGSWSTMLSLRKNMNGGGLHLPEYDVTLGIPDRSITIFNGQALWHGVTPIIPAKKDAYRFTLVWYAKRKICNCVAATEEANRAAHEAMMSGMPEADDEQQ